jgi:hypothetical protein
MSFPMIALLHPETGDGWLKFQQSNITKTLSSLQYKSSSGFRGRGRFVFAAMTDSSAKMFITPGWLTKRLADRGPAGMVSRAARRDLVRVRRDPGMCHKASKHC